MPWVREAANGKSYWTLYSHDGRRLAYVSGSKGTWQHGAVRRGGMVRWCSDRLTTRVLACRAAELAVGYEKSGNMGMEEDQLELAVDLGSAVTVEEEIVEPVLEPEVVVARKRRSFGRRRHLPSAEEILRMEAERLEIELALQTYMGL